ncbi:MAG: segregation and condensation protein B [Microbacteriaceae bacterium BACL25 MAG-120322-bin65]|nr:MAG: segregation and condensation protein B [Microbacteriaceae bacterium BACL25 MAG-120322-bin65]
MSTNESDSKQSATSLRNVVRELEAVMMVAEEPMAVVSLATALDVPVAEIKKALAELVADYDGELGGPERGFELREVGGGWRIYVRESFDSVVANAVAQQQPAKLSPAALETLAVIAYKQPVTRGHVSSIRAVNVDSVVRTLLGRGLIRESHSDPETGAIFYVTTDVLLTELGLESLDQLPPLSPLLDDGAEGFAEHE